MGSSPTIILQEISSLLGLLNGVTVLEVAGGIDAPRIDLTIESEKTHLLLQYCAEAANVHLDCWTQCKPSSVEAKSNPAKALRYRYQALSGNGNSGEAMEYISLLDAFIAWEMYKAGEISSDEEKRVTTIFNACSKST